MWQNIFIGVGEFAGIVAGFAWVARAFITQYFNQQADLYKAELNRDADSYKAELSKDAEAFKAELGRKTEFFKSELEKLTLEHEVRFRRIDEKVADALSEMYERIHRLQSAVGSLVAPFEALGGPSKEEKLKIAQTARHELNECLITKRLYLPPDLYEKTMKIADKLAEIANTFVTGYEQRKEHGHIESWAKAWNEMANEAKPLFDEIAAAFQTRIGVV